MENIIVQTIERARNLETELRSVRRSISTQLRKTRGRLGLTLAQVGGKVGLAPATIHNAERNKQLTLRTAAKLGRFYDKQDAA